MTLAWPWALALLLLVPALATAYLWQLRRRRREAVRHSSVALVRAAAPRSPHWRRHAPFALVLAALSLLGLAAARPQVEAQVPVHSAAVIMAVDVSGSMCATDVDPNRLAAAQEAVRTFVNEQDDDTRIGLVLFSGFAQLAVSPTTDRDAVLQAIDTLTTGRGTTIGAAILKSLDAIAEINPDVPPVSAGDPLRQRRRRRRRRSSCCSRTAPTPAAPRRRRRPSRLLPAGCASTRSASAR